MGPKFLSPGQLDLGPIVQGPNCLGSLCLWPLWAGGEFLSMLRWSPHSLFQDRSNKSFCDKNYTMSGAQLSRGSTLRGPIVHFLRRTIGPWTVGPPDNRAPDSWAPVQSGPRQLGPGPNCPVPNLPQTIVKEEENKTKKLERVGVFRKLHFLVFSSCLFFCRFLDHSEKKVGVRPKLICFSFFSFFLFDLSLR